MTHAAACWQEHAATFPEERCRTPSDSHWPRPGSIKEPVIKWRKCQTNPAANIFFLLPRWFVYILVKTTRVIWESARNQYIKIDLGFGLRSFYANPISRRWCYRHKGNSTVWNQSQMWYRNKTTTAEHWNQINAGSHFNWLCWSAFPLAPPLHASLHHARNPFGLLVISFLFMFKLQMCGC